MDAMQIANSLPLWLACAIPVIVVVAQAILFLRGAVRGGRKVGLTRHQIREAARSSAITSLGPSIVIVASMLSLLVTVGGPMAWMRLSMIGSVMFESAAANMGTTAVGVTLGVDEMTAPALTMAVWTMALGSIGWVIWSTFSASRMERIQVKVSGGNAARLAAIAGAAIIGVFSAMSATNLVRLDKSSLACVLGALIMCVMIVITERLGLKRLKEWNLTVSIILAMLITALV